MNMPPVWYIEARANAFVPYIFVKDGTTIEATAKEAERLKRKYQWYSVRVRAY